jgi:pyridoxal 5'-phosphate synthase pdxT subunit
MKRVGIIAAQGDIAEHILSVENVFRERGEQGEAIPVRSLSELDSVHAVILPGGESTAISKLLVKFGLHDALIERTNDGMPIMGTCAGSILLSSRGGYDVTRTETKLLGLMDMEVNRNAFGRQRESFQTRLRIEGFDDPYEAIFIRAPAITEVWGKCSPLARVDDYIVMAQQDVRFALTFHPELTPDTRLHSLLIDEI